MKSGDFITCSAPIGYVLKNKTLVPDPQEAPIVEYIFSSYLAGKSIGEIADELNEAELKSDKKNSEQWHATIIRYILSLSLIHIWPHPDMEHGIEEVIGQVESLKKKLRLETLDANCRIIEENTQRGPGYRFAVSAK